MNNHRKQYPVKTSVNLLYRKKSSVSPMQMLLAAAVFAIVLAVFSKFAVIDRLSAAGKAQREAENIEKALADVRQSNSDYEEVLREYQHYYFSAADSENGDPKAYVDYLDVLEFLDAELLYRAETQTINLAGNMLTVNLTKITLEDASVIAGSLARYDVVKDVRVSSANRQQEAEGATVCLNITLETQKTGGAGQNMDAGEDE